MARDPAPCGTFTAYKRHRRNDEPVDAACQEAAREQQAGARVRQSTESASRIAEVLELEPPVELVDELEDAKENLRILRAAMTEAPASAVAGLSKQRAALVAHIKKLEAPQEKAVSALDQLASRRANRKANSAS